MAREEYLDTKKLHDNKGKECNEEGCKEDAKSRGYCRKHYTKHYRLGDFENDLRNRALNKDKICKVEGCERSVDARGYCGKHKQRVYKGQDPTNNPVEWHGLSKTPEHSIWEGIRDRCNNPNTPCYKNYGGRGIKLSKEWQESFLCFYNDMGKRPTKKHQIDRINNSEGYSKENCRWVLQIENARNKRSTKMTVEKVRSLRDDKKELSFPKLAEKYSISVGHAKDIYYKKSWKDI